MFRLTNYLTILLCFTLANAEQSATCTCTFTVDNDVYEFYVDGVDASGSVTNWNQRANWPTPKSIDFACDETTRIALKAADGNGHSDGCGGGGFAMYCVSTDTSSVWHELKSGTDWKAWGSRCANHPNGGCYYNGDTNMLEGEPANWYANDFDDSAWANADAGRTTYASSRINNCGAECEICVEDTAGWLFRSPTGIPPVSANAVRHKSRVQITLNLEEGHACNDETEYCGKDLKCENKVCVKEFEETTSSLNMKTRTALNNTATATAKAREERQKEADATGQKISGLKTRMTDEERKSERASVDIKKLFTDTAKNATVVNGRLTKVEGKATATETKLTQEITAVNATIAINTANITKLEGRATATEGKVETLENLTGDDHIQVTKLDQTLFDMKDNLEQDEGKLTYLTTRVDKNRDDVHGTAQTLADVMEAEKEEAEEDAKPIVAVTTVAPPGERNLKEKF